jgi:hypothetical protein
MANEAVIIELPRNINAIRRTCAEATTIEKLTLCKLTDPNTIAASSARDEWGGVLAMEKVGGDGSTSASVHLDGTFDMLIAAGGSTSIGEAVTLSGTNQIDAATEAEIQLGKFIGWSEETGSSAEVVRVRLRGS